MSDSIVVNASATLAKGVGAHFNLVVDGVTIGQATAAAGLQGYGFNTTLSQGAAHSIQVVFDNDAFIDGEDRNLLLQSITVNGKTVLSTDSLEVYHATSGPGDLPSNGNMYWDGAAEFRLPASFFASTPAPTSTSAPSGPAFYVATTGSDAGDGSAARPFATLERALNAMQGGAVRTTYVQGGTYQPSSTLRLDQAASGVKFEAYPGQIPVLDGGASNLGTLVALDGASNVTLSGLTFANARGNGAVSLTRANANNITGNHFLNNERAIVLATSVENTVSGNQIDNSAQAGIELKDGSDRNVLDSNLIRGVSATGTAGGGFFVHGASYNSISHNVVENTAGIGIGIENWDNATINIGNTVDYNIVRNTGTGTAYDSGGIYVLGRSRLDTGTVINNNLIDRTGPGGDAHDVAIYLDDYTSGVTITNNITRNVGTHGLQIHAGKNINVDNNIFDLGSNSNSAVLFQDIGGDGVVSNVNFTQNVIISSKSSQLAFDDYSDGSFNIRQNNYWMSNGQQMQTSPADANPNYGNPNFQSAASGNYALGSGSAAAQIGFEAIDQTRIGLQPTTAHWYA